MSPERKAYQLQSEDGNRGIDALLAAMGIAEESRRFFDEMLTTTLKMHEDGTPLVDLKLTSAALKEMRYGFKVFAPWRQVPKVTVFGSARTAADTPLALQAEAFGRRMTAGGWMVITGAGSGVMGAAQAGAGRERSFGLNIRLPFEQTANPWIADDPKLITFKYFFTRKLFLVREAYAMAFFPGGFGTFDEVFESLTLQQTGKAAMVPLVLVDVPGGTYWQGLLAFVREHLEKPGMIAPEDTAFVRVTDDVETAAQEIERFYRVFHSQRYVGDRLLLRLRRPVPESLVRDLSGAYADILDGPIEQAPGPLAAERGDLPELPRLVLPFNRRSFGRLRLLVDAVNLAP